MVTSLPPLSPSCIIDVLSAFTYKALWLHNSPVPRESSPRQLGATAGVPETTGSHGKTLAFLLGGSGESLPSSKLSICQTGLFL